MSTSLLHHGFGLKGYHYVSIRYQRGSIILSIRQKHGNLRCPACNSSEIICRGKVQRRFRSLPTGLKPVWIILAIQRVFCMGCGVLRQCEAGFTDPCRSYTRSFERYALELSRHMTILDVAHHLGVSWDVIKDTQKRHLQRHYSRPKLRHLKKTAIDEISIGKRHQYLTVVLDLETGAVVLVGDGKSAEVLEPFWKKIKCSGLK